MALKHAVFLVEELSMEQFLASLLPRWLPEDVTFEIHSFQGKMDLLQKLEPRLRGYAAWLPEQWRIWVLLDRDADDCRELKRQLEDIAARVGLLSKSTSTSDEWHIAHRIVIEELEAWYFGDWEALCTLYPRLPRKLRAREAYRDPEGIAGGTWEALERLLQSLGEYSTGLGKSDLARRIGSIIDVRRCDARSFLHFHASLMVALGKE